MKRDVVKLKTQETKHDSTGSDDDSTDDDVAQRALKPGTASTAEATTPQVDEDEKNAARGLQTQRNQSAVGNPVTTSGTQAAVMIVDYDAMSEQNLIEFLSQNTKKQCLSVKQFRPPPHVETVEGHLDDMTAGHLYNDMLARAFRQHYGRGAGQQSKLSIPVPILVRIGSKKTSISNFSKICEGLNRTPEDVKVFIEQELSTRGSIDVDGCLILAYQKLIVSVVENVLVKYFTEYVECSACRKSNTRLEKNETHRQLQQVTCLNCKSTRTVNKGNAAAYIADTKKRRFRPQVA